MLKIKSELKSLFDQMPGAWGCKDNNSVFMYANEEYAQLIGANHKEEIVGKTDFDMPCDTVNAADLFRKQDIKVIQRLHKLRVLDIHPFAGGAWKAYIFTKTPLMEKDKCIGTIFHGADITSTTTLEIGALLARTKVEGISNDLIGQNSYMISSKFHEIKLTDRQSEVLFYTLRGKTVKQIGRYLKISPRTAEEYLEQLRFKFSADNKHSLIDSAIENGYLNLIPETLFRQQLSLELED